MVPAGYFLLVIFSNYFTVKRGNLAYFSSFLSLLKSNLKKSLIGSTQLGPFWIAIMNLYIKSFQKIYIFWECLIFCLNQTLAGCVTYFYFFRLKSPILFSFIQTDPLCFLEEITDSIKERPSINHIWSDAICQSTSPWVYCLANLK